MKFRQTDTVAGRGGQGRVQHRDRLSDRCTIRSCHRRSRRPRGRRRPDPLADIFEAEIVPMLKAAPGLRAVAVFEEMLRRHPDLGAGIRRTLERRIRAWRALHGAGAGGDLPPDPRARPDGRCRTSPTWAISASPSPARRSIIGSITSACVWSGFEHAHVILGGESYRRAGRRAAERAVGARRQPARASQRQPVGRVPQPRCRRPHRPDPALRGAVRALRHDAEPQQSRRRARERLDRERARPSQAAPCATRCCCAARPTSTIWPPIAASSTKSSAARTAATPPASMPSARHLQPLPDRRTCDYEEVDRHRHLAAAASRCARCSTPCPRG